MAKKAKEELVLRLLKAKAESGKTFSMIGRELGVTNAYAGQLFHRQATLHEEQTPGLQRAVPQLTSELLEDMAGIPTRLVDPDLIQDPTIYRFYEAVMHYAESLKMIIDEDFGDGVMSGTDFLCDLQKVTGKDGEDRVQIVMSGKFIPYEIFIQKEASFQIEEATVYQMQLAMQAGILTSRKLVEYYRGRISELNPNLKAVIEENPDALTLADKADIFRQKNGSGSCKGLRGIPVLIKDCIATDDELKTTAGSLALADSVVPRDAGVVKKLRDAGAIILGKANMSEWMNFRSPESYHGWSARGGQTVNPYDPEQTTCGSSSGSAVAVAANMVAVSLGTETNGSILCPSSFASVVGIKPTVGLTSRAGVIPISPTQDTVGPICRTVADAVEVLDVLVGVDELDSGTAAAAGYIPSGGYKQFLKLDGLLGKKLGVLGSPFTIDEIINDMNKLLSLAADGGAVIVKDLDLPNSEEILSAEHERVVLQIDFKHELAKYLSDLKTSTVRSLQDVINFNEEHKDEELSLFGQEIFVEAQARTDDQHSEAYRAALARNKFLTENGIDYLLKEHQLDALVAPTASAISFPAATAGYPAITIPAGYVPPSNFPFGICFVGSKGSEGVLIEIAYALEQRSRMRKPPPLHKAMPNTVLRKMGCHEKFKKSL